MSEQDRFANAPRLPFALSREWFSAARRLWMRHWLLIPFWALVVLAFRWQLDFFEGGVVIFLSYFTDALLFAWLFLGLRAAEAGGGAPLRAGWTALQGRRWTVMRAGVWGLPGALFSYLIFTFGPDLIQGGVVAVGSNLLGIAALLALVLGGGYFTFLAMLWPVLAAIQTARSTAETSLKAGGLWAFRSLHAGWRPLLVVFISFVAASFLAGLLFMEVLGHLPLEVLMASQERFFGLRYWFSWPGLFVAMNAFLALLVPLGESLLGAADEDLSDEVSDAASAERAGNDLIARVFERLGFTLRSVAALALILLVTAGGDWLGLSVFGFLWGGSCYTTARSWREGAGKWGRYRFLWTLPGWLLVASWL